MVVDQQPHPLSLPLANVEEAMICHLSLSLHCRPTYDLPDKSLELVRFPNPRGIFELPDQGIKRIFLKKQIIIAVGKCRGTYDLPDKGSGGIARKIRSSI